MIKAEPNLSNVPMVKWKKCAVGKIRNTGRAVLQGGKVDGCFNIELLCPQPFKFSFNLMFKVARLVLVLSSFGLAFNGLASEAF